MDDQIALGPIAVLGKLPKYDGRTSITKFLKQIDKRGKLENWNDDRKALIIRYLCTDIAEAFIDSRPELEDSTFPELCEALKNRFKLKISKPAAYSQLMGIKQGSDQINDYAGKIESTAAELSEIIPELGIADSREQLLISVFLSGISKSLKTMLISKEYDDFAELVRTAKRCEETLNESQTVNTAFERSSTYHASGSNTRQQYGNNAARFQSQSNQLTRSNIRGQSQAGVDRSQCYNCGSGDHYARYCPRNRRNNNEPN